MHVELQKFWRQKNLKAKGWFCNCGIICIQLWEFSYHPYEGRIKRFLWELIISEDISNVRVFSLVWNNHFWSLIPKQWVCGKPFHIKHLAIQHYANESYFLHIMGGGVSRHQQMWRIWILVMILVRESQKWIFVLHELCISTCVSWVEHVAY
jgi:hypothetical protein